jgi:ATP-dependent helicase Lhr and Lhr-like helicase
MNLAGIVLPGDRVSAVPGKQVLYRNGTLHSESEPDTITEKPALPIASALLPASVPTLLPMF